MLAFALWLLTRGSGISWALLWQHVHKPVLLSALTFVLLQWGLPSVALFFGLTLPELQLAEHWLLLLELVLKGSLGLACYISLKLVVEPPAVAGTYPISVLRERNETLFFQRPGW